ncbi:MAG: T9SS type A sorting domain-containing protein [Bacteroidota bacterium]
MKKIYALSLLVIAVSASQAATINVTVSDNVFTPASFSAVTGDVVVWSWTGSMAHNVTSVTIPTGAVSFASPTQASGTFSYTITVAGNYGYVCTLHQTVGMVGGFTVTASGIDDPAVKASSLLYPNPCMDKVTVEYSGADEIRFTSVTGLVVKSVVLDPSGNRAEIDLSDLPAGIYFYSALREGMYAQTRRIIKL